MNKTKEVHYIFDLQGKVLEEIDVINSETISSVFLKSRHLARVSGDETLYYGLDHQGTTVLVTDEDGNKVWEGESSPFGDNVTVDSERDDLDFLYTGKSYDEDTDLYYFNARFYDASTGRFITEDPARDGQNWYLYTQNNPLKYIDPTGMMSDSASLAAAEDPHYSDMSNSDSPYGHTHVRDEYDYRDFKDVLDHVIAKNKQEIEENQGIIEKLKNDILSTEIGKRKEAIENLAEIAELGNVADSGTIQEIAEFAAESSMNPPDYHLDFEKENRGILEKIKEILGLEEDNDELEKGLKGLEKTKKEIEESDKDDDDRDDDDEKGENDLDE